MTLFPAALALAASALAAEPSLLLSKPQTALADEIIELRPAAGHHFNPEAPNKCGDKRASSVTPRVFRCQLVNSGRVPVVASVCDDAKTFCRQERFEIVVKGARAQAGREKSAGAKPHAAPPGFLVNEPGKAITFARREKKPLFVHFYGIWCPPCNMLEESVYPTETFQKAAEGWIKLALDADAELSWAWKAKFKVGGYPTLLALDERGQEVDRAVGYRSPEALAAFLARAEKETEPVAAAAEAVAKAAPAAEGGRRARVARWRLERAEREEALAAAGAAPEARRWALSARSELAQRADDPAAAIAALKELTASYPDDADFVGWADELAKLDKDAGAALSDAVRRSVDKWSADPKLGEHGLVPGDLREQEAWYWEALGKADEARAAYAAGAEAYGAQAKASKRGASLEQAYCLGKAGRSAEARALYESLLGQYPDEFTFHYNYGRLLLELGEHQAALARAKDAVRSGYGDNWLRAVALEAKALKALDRKPEAAAAIDAALAESAAPKSAAVRTHRYLADLRRLRAEL